MMSKENSFEDGQLAEGVGGTHPLFDMAMGALMSKIGEGCNAWGSGRGNPERSMLYGIAPKGWKNMLVTVIINHDEPVALKCTCSAGVVRAIARDPKLSDAELSQEWVLVSWEARGLVFQDTGTVLPFGVGMVRWHMRS